MHHVVAISRTYEEVIESLQLIRLAELTDINRFENEFLSAQD